MGNSDASTVVLDVGGRLIREFDGLKGWKPGKTASYNMGNRGVAHGFNLQSEANTVEFDIMVRDTSPDLGYLHDLSMSQERVQVVAYVPEDKLAPYEVDQEVGLGGAQCLILPGERSKGAGDAESVTFHVMAIGPIVKRKQNP